MATPTSAKDWKGKTETGAVDLTLPSGNVCLIKRIPLEQLISNGMIPDSLGDIAMSHVDMATGKIPQDHKKSKKKADDEFDKELMKKVMADPEKLRELFQTFDRVTAEAVISPTVMWHMRPKVDSDGIIVRDDNNKPVLEEIPNDERDTDNVLYTDQVDSQDKNFIFNFVVGGTSDLEKFRNATG